MKNLFRIPIAMFVASLILVGCSKDGVQEETVNNSNTFNSTLSVDMTPEEESLKFFRKHMAVVDARVRSLSSEKFVREIYLANFSEESWSKNKIGLGGYPFSDDGEGNDLIANDGIYTSLEEYAYKEEDNVEYDDEHPIVSYLDYVFKSQEFQHNEELIDLYYEYVSDLHAESGSKPKKPEVELKAHVSGHCESVYFCSEGCIADWIWDELGCICFENCGDIDFSFDFNLSW